MADVREGRDAWDAVAAFWHERMGDGNDFVDVLIWPVIKQLLPNLRGSRVLDVGCGNGLYARKLAAEGARVTAVDYSSHMIAQAQAATQNLSIEYRVVDASDSEGMSSLPKQEFDQESLRVLRLLAIAGNESSSLGEAVETPAHACRRALGPS